MQETWFVILALQILLVLRGSFGKGVITGTVSTQSQSDAKWDGSFTVGWVGAVKR